MLILVILALNSLFLLHVWMVTNTQADELARLKRDKLEQKDVLEILQFKAEGKCFNEDDKPWPWVKRGYLLPREDKLSD